MAQKFLDLDKVKKPLGAFTLNGETYEVLPIKIKNVINLTMLEDAILKDDEGSLTQQMDTAMDLLTELIPGCPRETLESMSVDQFNALMEWVQSFGDQAIEKNSRRPVRQVQ